MSEKRIASLIFAAVLIASFAGHWAFAQQASTGPAATGPATAPATQKAAKYIDPVPHEIITQPYRVCQDLEELTARIDNLYRKPFDKVFDSRGFMQPEVVYFKDTVTGHEIMSLTRELCSDIAHGDLGRPAWTCDGRKIPFMGTRGYIDVDGSFKKSDWPGHKYIMNADYSDQRALIVTYKDKLLDKRGKTITRTAGIYSKYNMMDPQDPRYAYYALNDKLWRVTLNDDNAQDSVAEIVCEFSNSQNKIVQDISYDRKILLQDANADPDKNGKLPYMPEIHLVDLSKKPGEKGFYYHHPLDYGLPEVKDDQGKVVHDAANNYQFHSLAFGKTAKTIGWNYGSMTQVGEYLGWSLDITSGLDGTPTHGAVTGGSSKNPFGQYESHGKMIGGDSTFGLYYGGPATLSDGKKLEGYGLWLRNFADSTQPPKFIMTAPGGHVAGGNSRSSDIWASFVAAEWRDKVKESDAIVWGHASKGDCQVLCYTYSDVRGGIKKDSKTGKLTWSGMDNNDYRPYSSIPRPLLSPDATKLWFHSCMLQPNEEYVGIYVAVTQKPAPPTDLRLADGAKGVRLEWQRAKMGFETKCFHVYRGDENGENFVEVDTVPIAKSAPASSAAESVYSYTDISARPGKTYTYAVTAEEWSMLESDTTSNSLVVQVKPDGVTATPGPAVTGWDKTPPPAVAKLTVTKESDEDGQYRLKWQASPAKDLRHYNVYFSAKGKPAVGNKRLIASPLPGMTEYLDWSAPLDAKKVYYAITAVDRQGNESTPTYGSLTAQAQ